MANKDYHIRCIVVVYCAVLSRDCAPAVAVVLQWSGVVLRTSCRLLVARLLTIRDVVSMKSQDSSPPATITSEFARATSKASGRLALRWSAFLQVSVDCFSFFSVTVSAKYQL